MPPKGIVNAGQLEKELMRIFANAVMFNPDVSENRGLGPAFRTRRRLRGGTTDTGTDTAAEADQAGGEGTRFEIGVAAPVEGAVVQDTRAVARDVQESFAAWRAVERARENDIFTLGELSVKMSEEAGDAIKRDEEEGGNEEVKPSVEEEEEGERRSKRRRR